jgi:hypothetical protein
MCDFLWTGYLIADEFPAELAAGAAYVAGFDDDGRPVLVCPAVILQCLLGNNAILPLCSWDCIPVWWQLEARLQLPLHFLHCFFRLQPSASPDMVIPGFHVEILDVSTTLTMQISLSQ